MFQQITRHVSTRLKAVGGLLPLSERLCPPFRTYTALVSMRAWQPEAYSGASNTFNAAQQNDAPRGVQRLFRQPASEPALLVSGPQQHARAITATAVQMEKMQSVESAGTAYPASAASSSSRPSPAAATASQIPPPSGLAAVPPVARVLGFAGAIPFLALSPPIAEMLPLLPAGLLANAALLQIGYGATIASFLGGIHWAMAMAEYGGRALSASVQAERYLWSVTPCLMAWPAVILDPGPGSLIVGTTLGVVYAVDRHFAAKGLLPAWYMALRLPLTLAALTGLACTLTTSLFYGSRPRTLQPAA
ncbi:probable transmembrane protein 69 at C-terminar half [Coccomyxa sp. Obi]|nr:probable transmembrane protein 69 at C-terminar half [Coccomyxa sp. Obi]